MDAKELQRLIDIYRDEYHAVAEVLDGITEGELDRSGEDGWTPRQIVRPIEPSLGAFRSVRETNAQLLGRMTEDEWGRAGRHTERGAYSAEWLEMYVSHAHDHAAQIRRARGRD